MNPEENHNNHACNFTHACCRCCPAFGDAANGGFRCCLCCQQPANANNPGQQQQQPPQQPPQDENAGRGRPPGRGGGGGRGRGASGDVTDGGGNIYYGGGNIYYLGAYIADPNAAPWGEPAADYQAYNPDPVTPYQPQLYGQNRIDLPASTSAGQMNNKRPRTDTGNGIEEGDANEEI